MEKLANNKQKFDWWAYLKTTLTSLLKNKLIQVSIAKIATYTVVGPVKAWLISFVIENLFDHLVEPLLVELGLQGQYQIDIHNGRKTIKLIKKAREDNNEDAYNRASDDV